MKLSIIIVNYNGCKFLKECIDSIRNYVNCDHEVILVDNASSDGSVEYIEKYYPEIKLVISDINLGFTGGNNLAAKHAQGDLLLLLNNDTRLLSELSPAINDFSQDTKLGCLGCKMYYGDGRLQASFGYDHTPLRIVLSWLVTKNAAKLPKLFHRTACAGPIYDAKQLDVAWVSGAFLMTRRSLWEKLNGLDDVYFMYVEDVDYCRRIRDLGYRVDYMPNIEITHYEGSGKPWIGTLALKRTMRSYIIYTKKFYGPLSVLFVRLGMLAVLVIRGLAFAFQSIINNSEVLHEKRVGYFSAAGELLKLKRMK